jgi:hypothetical protein
MGPPRHLNQAESLEVIVAGTSASEWFLQQLDDDCNRFCQLCQQMDARELTYFNVDWDYITPSNPSDPSVRPSTATQYADEDEVAHEDHSNTEDDDDDDDDNATEAEVGEEETQYIPMPIASIDGSSTVCEVRDCMVDPSHPSVTRAYHLSTYQGRLLTTTN